MFELNLPGGNILAFFPGKVGGFGHVWEKFEGKNRFFPTILGFLSSILRFLSTTLGISPSTLREKFWCFCQNIYPCNLLLPVCRLPLLFYYILLMNAAGRTAKRHILRVKVLETRK